ncbi:transmembrane protein 53 [Quillaja saponaria]|uniref:Transmembrane protein 53 n=1 Tax=Quillaja saponaria TaxID=32244 RepID=A0AAD7P558_QUISA|nr:transmembrane protein 53 [Quillaja saponaria]
MSSLSGSLQRPLVAATAAVAVASVSKDLSDKTPSHRSSDTCSTSDSNNFPSNSLWVSHISSFSKLANISFVARIRVPLPNMNFPIPNSHHNFIPNMYNSSVASSPALLNLYQSAELPKVPKPTAYYKQTVSSPPSEVMYKWHLPEPNAVDVLGDSDCSSARSRTVVVLLGWLGAKQKHLKTYAEWYTSRGFHAITFTFPLAEVLSYQLSGKADQHIDLLVEHLSDWLEEENGKNLLFHTFSNTGWLTYGVMLEKFQKQYPSILGRIKGCIVDSAPAASPDPQVWASGFSAALLKKNSIATKGSVSSNESVTEVSVDRVEAGEPKPAITEIALLVLLEKFFEVVLNLPTVNRRLSDVLSLLSSRQPSCPQLYIYSSSDRVIPAGSVESFVEQQRRAGHQVRACNFVSTPHVDHFRNDPKLYASQLTKFLEDCVLACRRPSN